MFRFTLILLALCALFLTPAPATANGGDETPAAQTTVKEVNTESSSQASSKTKTTTTKTTRRAAKALAPAATPAAEEFTENLGYSNGRYYVAKSVVDSLGVEGSVYIRTNSHVKNPACAGNPKCEKCAQEHSFRKENSDQWHDYATTLQNGFYVTEVLDAPPGNGQTLEMNAVVLAPTGKRVYWPSGSTKSVGVDNLMKGRMVQFKLN